jgi:hypothetical protein
MAIQSVLEKLQYNNEKNILIQGLPSAVEKQFMKITFSKSVTPLLLVKKVDFALVFAVSQKQLNDIITEIMPALHVNTKLWVAHPKPTAKIASDLCRVLHWRVVEDFQLEAIEQIEMDNVWCATNFKLEGEAQSISNSVPRHKLANAEMELV